MKRKTLILLCIILAAVIIFSSCGPGGQRQTSERRDDVNISLISEWTTLDPAFGNDMLVFLVLSQFYEGLVRINVDDSIMPGLATHWDISPDGLQYTFHLRPGITFHNGDPITADDVVFSYNRAVASPATSRVTGTISRTDKIDDRTVRVTLRHAYAPFIACAGMANLGIVPQRVVEEMGDAAFARNPVGSGPYMFVEWRPGDRLIMEAFPNYWQGPAPIKHAQYRIISDPSTATIALERGDIDVIYSVPAAERATIKNNPNLTYFDSPGAAHWFLAFNMQEGRFANNPLLREAVAYAVNREDIIMGGLEGDGFVTYAPFTPGAFGWPEGFVGRQQDTARARQLLAQAGYPNGMDINIRTFESANYARPAEIMQEQLRQAGFNARVELMERSAYMSDVFTNGQYEITFTSLTALVPDSDFHVFIRFHSAFKGGGVNITFTDVPEMDRLVEIGRYSTDPQERLETYWAIAELNHDLNIKIPLYVHINATASVNGLSGVATGSAYIQHIYDMSWN